MSDHEKLLDVALRWERLYQDTRVKELRLREALQALVDATETAYASRVILDAMAFDAARTVALALLAKGEPQ